jgi:methyl halide transferase
MNDLTPEAWEERYQTGQDPWNLGFPAPPLVDLLASAALLPGSVAVLGCGAGSDALFFAEAGFEVMGFDFATSAIDRAQQNARDRNLPVRFLQRDIFALPAEFPQQFDYVVEHTCFCAIDVTLRSDYVRVVKDLLRTQGKLLGLFFTHSRPGGPPFGVKPQEVLDLFAPHFDILEFRAAEHSIERRQGEEHLGIFQVR